MSFLLSLSLLAAVPLAGLSLQVDAPDTAVLVGEPVKIVMTWQAGSRPVKGVYVEDEDFLSQSLAFVVDDGTTRRTYREFPRGLAEYTAVPIDLRPREAVSRNLVLARGGYPADSKSRPVPGLLFGAKGRYSIKVAYVAGGQWQESNSVSFTVTEPTGADREILALLLQDPLVIEGAGPAKTQARLREIVEKNPSSHYLRWPRIKLLERRAIAVHNRMDPDTGERLSSLDPDGLARMAARHYNEIAQQCLEGQWGSFEEEALALAIRYARAAGDEGMAEKAKEELLRKHPDSATARQIRASEGEEDEDEGDKPSPQPPQ